MNKRDTSPPLTAICCLLLVAVLGLIPGLLDVLLKGEAKEKEEMEEGTAPPSDIRASLTHTSLATGGMKNIAIKNSKQKPLKIQHCFLRFRDC